MIYQDPRTSTPGLGLLLWMQKVYGDDAPQAWQKLAKKTVTVTKGWSEAYGLFLKGESDLVLSYTTSPAYHILEEKKDNYAAANFSEGHYLQVEVAARTAASKQPELAQNSSSLWFLRLSRMRSQPATGCIRWQTSRCLPVLKIDQTRNHVGVHASRSGGTTSGMD